MASIFSIHHLGQFEVRTTAAETLEEVGIVTRSDETGTTARAEMTERAEGRSSQLAVAFFTLLVVGTDLFIVSPILPQIARTLHVSEGTAGLTVTVFSIAYLVSAPIIGRINDRGDPRRTTWIALLCFGGGNLLSAISPNLAVLLLARFITGASAAAITPSIQGLVGRTAPPTKRASWLAIAAAGFLISITTGAPLGSLVASVSSWRIAFVLITVLAVAMSLINRGAWRTTDHAIGPKPQGNDRQFSSRTSEILVAVAVTGLWAFFVYSMYTYLGSELGRLPHASQEGIVIGLVAYGIGAVLGSVGGGRLADRFGPQLVITGSLSLGAVALLLLGLAIRSHNMVLIVLALACFSISSYPCLPALQVRIAHSYSDRMGSAFSWNSFMMYLGTSVGAAVGGVMFSSGGFTLITIVGACVAVATAFYSRFLAFHRNEPEPRTQQR